jgi:hypothetical protein
MAYVCKCVSEFRKAERPRRVRDGAWRIFGRRVGGKAGAVTVEENARRLMDKPEALRLSAHGRAICEYAYGSRSWWWESGTIR